MTIRHPKKCFRYVLLATRGKERQVRRPGAPLASGGPLMADRAARRRFDRAVRKEGDQLRSRIAALLTSARTEGWDDVVVELEQADELVLAAEATQARLHIEEAVRLIAAHRYRTASAN